MRTHAAAAMPIATSMFLGGSFAFRPWSSPKNMYQGSLSPVWRNVPADASVSTRKIPAWWASPAAETTIDLLTNPLKSGTAEMANAPIM